MNQIEIKEKTPLLTPVGSVGNPGWSRKMNYIYNPQNAKKCLFKLKEWDFYQLQAGDWVLQITIGHVSYIGSFSARLFNIVTGESHEIGTMKPLPRIKMPLNPEEPNFLQIKEKQLVITFEVTPFARHLKVQGHGKEKVDVDIVLTNDPENEKMVIATPFEKQSQFYLNYKENYYQCRGSAAFGDRMVDFSQGRALLDWGRGIWPFSHEWFWGNGTGFVGGEPFAFNIGWGFGNTEKATENMFFYRQKAYKLGELIVTQNSENHMAPWHFKDEEGRLDVTMEPVYDNFTQNKVAFVNTSCHQVFGNFTGKAILPDGQELLLENFPAFCEHAVNRW